MPPTVGRLETAVNEAIALCCDDLLAAPSVFRTEPEPTTGDRSPPTASPSASPITPLLRIVPHANLEREDPDSRTSAHAARVDSPPATPRIAEDPGLRRARDALASFVGGVVQGTHSVGAILQILATAESALGGAHGTLDIGQFVVAAVGGRMLMLESEVRQNYTDESEERFSAHCRKAASACEFIRARTLRAHAARNLPLTFVVNDRDLCDFLDEAVDRFMPATLTYIYELGIAIHGHASGGLRISPEQWVRIGCLMEAGASRGISAPRITKMRDVLAYFVLGRPSSNGDSSGGMSMCV